MKNIIGQILLFSLIFFSQTLIAAVSRTSQKDGERYDFAIDIKSSKRELFKKTFVEYQITGAKNYEAILYREGFPKIPVIRFYVYADYPSDVEVQFSRDLDHQLSWRPNFQILPNIPAIPKIKNARAFFTLDTKAYEQDLYPQRNFLVEPAGSVKGRKRQLVSIYPLQLLGKKQALKLKSHFSVQVRTNQSIIERSLRKPAFLFIVGENFKNVPELKLYKEHKENLGFEVKTLIVTRALKDPNKIRQEVQRIYNDTLSDLKYALIIGDHEDVPGYEGQHLYGVTDHFYKCLDTNDYESDINAPDIALGRLSVSLESHLKNVLSKHMRYLQEEQGLSEWLQQASFIATDDQWEIAEGSHDYVINTHMKNVGFSGSFPQVLESGGDKLYAVTHKASRKELIDQLQKGRGIVNYSGHGQTTYWMEPELKMDDVKKLSHKSALPMVISNACVTGQFTVSESFAEIWQRHPQGAIMFWGSMDNTYWEEDDILEKRFYDGIYKLNLREFGAMTDYALAEFWRHYGGAGRSKYYYETYIHFGDPQMQLKSL